MYGPVARALGRSCPCTQPLRGADPPEWTEQHSFADVVDIAEVREFSPPRLGWESPAFRVLLPPSSSPQLPTTGGTERSLLPLLSAFSPARCRASYLRRGECSSSSFSCLWGRRELQDPMLLDESSRVSLVHLLADLTRHEQKVRVSCRASFPLDWLALLPSVERGVWSRNEWPQICGSM